MPVQLTINFIENFQYASHYANLLIYIFLFLILSETLSCSTIIFPFQHSGAEA